MLESKKFTFVCWKRKAAVPAPGSGGEVVGSTPESFPGKNCTYK